MKYQILYDPKSEKQLDKLPRTITVRIIMKMREVGETGRGIDITHNPSRMWVRYIDHRSRICKRL